VTSVRWSLLIGGIAMVLFGALDLARDDPHALVSTAVWLAGGVLVHDALLAPVTIAASALGLALLPRAYLAPAAATVVVLGSVTLVALPVLGRFGARPDNPTLLDRPYVLGWLAFAGLVLACAFGWALVRRRRDG
jgi:hypothetical protein